MGRFRPRNLIDFIRIIRRRKLMILFVAGVVLASAYLVIRGLPPLYESRTLILVSGSIYDRQANGAQIAAVTEQITSRANLEAIIQRYDLNPAGAKMDAAVESLEKAIRLETKYRSDSQGFPESFSLSYRNRDPHIAQQVVTDLVSVFNQANAMLEKQAIAEMKAIQEEMADINNRLSNIGHNRAANAARSSAASRAASAADRIRSERQATLSSVEELRNKQFSLQQQIASQKRLIVQQQDIVRNSPPADDNRPTGSYAALLRRKSDLEKQVKDLASQVTDKHPQLVAAREQLAEVNRQIADANAAGEATRAVAASPAAQELRRLQIELERYETDLEIVERELGRKQQRADALPAASSATYTGGGSSIAVSGAGPDDYDYQSLRERYSTLLKREDALREFQPSTTGPGTPFFQLVDQPNLPEIPAAPNRMKLMMFAAVMALGAALALVIIFEIPRLTLVSDERDVSYYLGVPVIALLPETPTRDERTIERRRALVRRLGFLLIGAAAVPAIVFALNALQVFQILGNK